MEGTTPILLSALMLGFVGSGHCLGMCGGIAGALAQVDDSSTRRAEILSSGLYSVGRISSYGMLGAVAGALGESLTSLVGFGPTVRVLAGLLIVAFGIHTAGGKLGFAWLERAGLRVWRRMSPLIGRVGPPDRLWKRLALGALWGWLPCGLVYSALAAAAVTGSVLSGAAFMVCFGLGTMPAVVLATGTMGSLGSMLRRRSARRAVGALLILFGGWTIFVAISSTNGHGTHSVHDRGAHESSMSLSAPR